MLNAKPVELPVQCRWRGVRAEPAIIGQPAASKELSARTDPADEPTADAVRHSKAADAIASRLTLTGVFGSLDSTTCNRPWLVAGPRMVAGGLG